MASVSISAITSVEYNKPFTLQISGEISSSTNEYVHLIGSGTMSVVSGDFTAGSTYFTINASFTPTALGSGMILAELRSESGQYVYATDTITLTVGKQVVTVADPTISQTKFTHTGNTITFTNYMTLGSNTHISGGSTSGSNAGPYTVSVSPDDETTYYKYQWSDGTTGAHNSTFYIKYANNIYRTWYWSDPWGCDVYEYVYTQKATADYGEVYYWCTNPSIFEVNTGMCKGLAGGECTYHATVDETDTYFGADTSCTVIVHKLVPQMTFGWIEKATYNGSPIRIIYGASCTGGSGYVRIWGDSAWTSISSQANITRTNAGSYYIEYKIDGNAQYESVPAEVLQGDHAEIYRANQSLTNPTLVSSPQTYTGSPIQLITAAGSAPHGTVWYGINNTNYTTSWSSVTGTNIGSYPVWAKVVSNSGNYNGVDPRLIGTIDIGGASKIYINTENGYQVAYPYVLTAINGATYVWQQAEGYVQDENGWHQLNHRRN